MSHVVKIKDIIQEVERFAPRAYQESYDNAKLICGDKSLECTGVILCLDAIEEVVEEAIRKGANLVLAHHPIVFSGLKSLTAENYIERTLIKAIKNDIAIYACHTNLDNVSNGVNKYIADRLGLRNQKVLQPKAQLLNKLYTYVPHAHINIVMDALFEAGAGHIGDYAECSFRVEGTGTFKASDNAKPFVGEKGLRHAESETKVEVLFPAHLQSSVLQALINSHPYEEVAYEIIRLENQHQEVGSGRIGNLPEPMEAETFLHFLKEQMQTACIRHTALIKDKVSKIALCGGAGSFLLPKAISAGADVFITGDFKYHQFFEADGRIVIADIGHYESEQFTIQLFYDILKKKFPNFALHLTSVNTNPVKYL